MEGTEAVIGAPGDVSTYILGSYFANKVVAENGGVGGEVLWDTSFVQGEEGSVLEFTKLLKEDRSDDTGVATTNDRYAIDGFGPNKFIWAVGLTNDLNYHAAFGSFELSLNPNDDCGEEAPEITIDTIRNYQLLFILHGIFAVLAFGIAMPLAITASRARNLFDYEWRKKKAWYVLHTCMNSVAYGLTVVLVVLVVVAYEKKGKDHFKVGVGGESKHEIVGLVTLLLMTVQIAAGVLRPDPFLPLPPPITTTTTATEAEIEPATRNTIASSSRDDVSYTDSLSGEMAQIDNEATTSTTTTMAVDNNKTLQVRMVRTIWQKSHIVMGISTLGCGIYQMHSGVKLYSILFQSNQESYVGTLWGLLGFVFLCVVGTILYSRKEIKNSKG